MPKPMIFQIKLLVETDDPAEVERLADAVAKAACPDDLSEGHQCSIPWFVITSPVDEPDSLRDLLNR
jgi:hypothetical protein